MIEYDHGRWRSLRTEEEQRKAALDAVRALKADERAGLQLVLDEYRTLGHSPIANQAAEFEWDETPMPIAEWLDSFDHVGETGKDLYPLLREDLCELFKGGALHRSGYAEAVLTGAIGWGKDYFGTTATVRMIYELCCLKNPQHTLGLAEGEPIHIVPISKTVAQAKRVVFGGVCKKLNLANWFRGMYVETMDEVRFKDKGIYIVGGASQDASALGLNVILALVDECVTEDTRILTPSGYQPVSALYDSSSEDQLTFGPIVSYDEKTGLGRADAGFIRPALEAEVFEVEFDDGRTIKATARHPFMVRRPWSDLDYVFLKDLKLGDEVVVVHDVRQVRGEQSLLWEEAHRGGEGEDRGSAAGEEATATFGGDQAQDQDVEPSHEGSQGQDRHRRLPGRAAGGGHSCGAREASAGSGSSVAAEAASVDARAAGWRRATNEEALAGSCLPGPDDRYKASLLSFPRGEGQDREGESQAEGRVQAQRSDQAEDQRELGVESQEGRLQLQTPLRFGEVSAKAEADLVGCSVAVGEARSVALGRGLCRSQFPVRTVGRPLHLGGEQEAHAAGLPGDDDRRLDGDDRGEASRVYLQREGTSEGRRLHRILRRLGLEVRSVGRATTVARIVAIRSKGRRRTFDVMSLPGGNFIADGLVVHNSNFMGAGKVTTGSASGESYDKATMIYNALARRVKSRYSRHGVSGLVMLISSKRSTDDFTERHIKASREKNDPRVFVRDYATWHVHPEPFEGQEWHRVLVSPKTGKSRLLSKDEEPEEDENNLIVEYPDDYHDEFKTDTDGAVRDFAGIATDFAGKLFITRRRAIDDAIDPKRPPWFRVQEWRTDQLLRIRWNTFMDLDVNQEPVPVCCGGSVRHVHIDLSTNQCSTGFCIGHVAGSVQVTRRDPDTHKKHREDAVVIHIDALLRINAPDGGDVDHGEVRGLVYRLMAKGVPIRSVSMDQYMAPPNLQLFKKKGLRVEEIGERRFHLKPYLTLRQTFYEGRIVMPNAELMITELKALLMDDKGKKVIKPPRGTKDLADALSGVVYYISENMRVGVVLAPSLGISTGPGSGGPLWNEAGDVEWDDDDRPRTPGSPGGNGEKGFSQWIVSG